MVVFIIILSALLLISLLRFGVIIEYSDAGFDMWFKAAFAKFRIKDEHKKKIEKKVREKRAGGLSIFLEILRAVKNALGRLKRRLLISKLTLHYISAGDDPAKTALLYGTANAVFGTIVPLLENNFRVKRCDFSASADFDASEQMIYAEIVISLAFWEIIYILFAFAPVFSAGSSNKTDRKDVQKDGKPANKRVDGNNDAENKGDD